MHHQTIHHPIQKIEAYPGKYDHFQTVMNLPLLNSTAEAAIDTLLAPGRKTVNFVNAHCANMSIKSADYASALARSDYLLPDGIGVELAAKMQGKSLTENLNGTDFVPKLLHTAQRKGLSVFLIGGVPGTANRAADRLCFDLPGLRVAGTRDGFDGANPAEDAVAAINASGADIVLVAMGVPLQEVWIDRNRPALQAPLVMGVGALFDFLAGNVTRAPKIIRKARMEWFWRLAMEPRRMAKRYLIGNFTFMARAARHAFENRDKTRAAQRALDIAMSSAALIVLFFPMALVAAAIAVQSKGTPIVKHMRVGKNGHPFWTYRFRIVKSGTNAASENDLKRSDQRTPSRHMQLTQIGKALHRLSLDGLPQLFNVFKGEMSIVGPRPALPAEVEDYPHHARARLRVRPGITGLWQVSGKASISYDKMIDLDLAYVRSQSTFLDVVLIAMTFRSVLTGRRAHKPLSNKFAGEPS